MEKKKKKDKKRTTIEKCHIIRSELRDGAVANKSGRDGSADPKEGHDNASKVGKRRVVASKKRVGFVGQRKIGADEKRQERNDVALDSRPARSIFVSGLFGRPPD